MLDGKEATAYRSGLVALPPGDDGTKQMSLRRETQRNLGSPPKHSYSLGLTLAVVLLSCSAVPSPAQLPTSAPPPSTTEAQRHPDPLGRATPRSTVLGFLKYAQSGDVATAARYMQLSPGQHTDLDRLAKELRALEPHFKGNINLLSDDPNGTVEFGLPPGEVRAGVITVGATTADVILVRVDDPAAGKIWLISQGTVANFDKLYAQTESQAPTGAGRFRLALQSGPRMLGMSYRKWIAWLLSIPVAWLLAWLSTLLVSAPRRVWYQLRNLPCRTVWDTPIGTPLKCLIAILFHSLFVYELHPPLLYRVYYSRFLEAIAVACLGWLAARIADRGFDRELTHMQAQHRGGTSILILMRRLSRVGILIIVLVAVLACIGFNVTATLAGLGIGGIAIALAAQKTLENFIGGLSLLVDHAVHIGDVCKIGDRVGTVEDIGLRSLKLRTVDQNLLVVPNGLLAQMQFENLKSRPKLLIDQKFSLRIETQLDQLRFVLDSVQKMLNEHPKIEPGTSRVRVIDFAGAAFELHLFAYAETGDMAEFTAIQQDVLLKTAEIVEAAGTHFAAPTRLIYQSAGIGVDTEAIRQSKDSGDFTGDPWAQNRRSGEGLNTRS